MSKDIIKEYGNVLHDPASITERPLEVLSVGPKLDIALGGGVPEGSLFIMTGPEKVGKTVTALTFCANAQKHYERKVYYANIEGRLKKRDLQGITDLSLDAEKMQIIGSTEGNILSAEKYLSIIDNIVHTQPGSLAIVDSFSALSSESELTGDLSDMQVMSVQKVLAKFCRRISNVLPINRVTVVGITHLMANLQRFGRGKTKVEKSGSALKYQVDVKLHASHSTALMQGDTQIGQTVHWQITTSAIGPPGQKVESHIRYGKGIWKEMEMADLMIDFGLISKAGAWLKLPNGEKIQGKVNLAKYLEENPEEYNNFRKEVFEMVGIDYEN
jgi:recombination protein RecA|tara:strand:- start:1713 stop:2699 length:987 start_codon:yes stop_codon:yes gene_type:complete